MKLLRIVFVAALFPFAAIAQDATPTDAFIPVSATDIVWADLMYVKRPVVIFADSPNDPNFVRQMELIAREPGELAERDVIVITDTDPDARSEIRTKLRPRGFSLVLLDKDLKPVIRKPLPWEVREITHAIDKFPLRRQEIMQGAGSGAGG